MFLGLGASLHPLFRTGNTITMDRREQILETAFNAFTTRGIKDVKMEDVASLMKISKKTLYEFFSSKKDLLVQSMKYKIPQLLQKIAKITKLMPNPLTAIVFCAIENVKFWSAFSDAFVSQVQSFEELGSFWQEVTAELHDKRDILLSRCVSEGYLREEDASRLVAVFMNNIKDFKEIKNQKVFPSQLCFNLVITILAGVCTQRGRKVLDELRDNYN